MTQDTDQYVWQKHNIWSETANRLKQSITRWRSIALGLGIAGAFLETLSTQIPPGVAQRVSVWLGAVCLSIIPVILQRKLNPAQSQAWVRARSASEGLKAEVYKFCAQASPYDDPANASGELQIRKQEIQENVKDLLARTALIEPIDEAPPGRLSPHDYIENRVRQQIDWYRPKAHNYAVRSRRFRTIEIVLAFIAAVLAAANGILPQVLSIGTVPLKIGVWVAVLTTIGGAMATHISASRYDFLVSSYLATADRLEDMVSKWPEAGISPSSAWSEFVHQCEDAISTENKAWMAKWAKATSNP